MTDEQEDNEDVVPNLLLNKVLGNVEVFVGSKDVPPECEDSSDDKPLACKRSRTFTCSIQAEPLTH